jgi:hypothetical protein
MTDFERTNDGGLVARDRDMAVPGQGVSRPRLPGDRGDPRIAGDTFQADPSYRGDGRIVAAFPDVDPAVNMITLTKNGDGSWNMVTERVEGGLFDQAMGKNHTDFIRREDGSLHGIEPAPIARAAFQEWPKEVDDWEGKRVVARDADEEAFVKKAPDGVDVKKLQGLHDEERKSEAAAQTTGAKSDQDKANAAHEAYLKARKDADDRAEKARNDMAAQQSAQRKPEEVH